MVAEIVVGAVVQEQTNHLTRYSLLPHYFSEFYHYLHYLYSHYVMCYRCQTLICLICSFHSSPFCFSLSLC